MPLFKLPFEEKRPITAPPAGQAQPLAERATDLTGVFAAGGVTAGTLGLVSGGAMGTGVVTTDADVLAGGAGAGVGRAVAVCD